jgi:hypothetical protein
VGAAVASTASAQIEASAKVINIAGFSMTAFLNSISNPNIVSDQAL